MGHIQLLEEGVVIESTDDQFNSMSLTSVLRTNHTLINLSLAHCDIDSKGACQLAIALSTNDTLNVLLMGENTLGVEGAAAIAEMLLKNKFRQEFYLDTCS